VDLQKPSPAKKFSEGRLLGMAIRRILDVVNQAVRKTSKFHFKTRMPKT
jgi:hypothetical protein